MKQVFNYVLAFSATILISSAGFANTEYNVTKDDVAPGKCASLLDSRSELAVTFWSLGYVSGLSAAAPKNVLANTSGLEFTNLLKAKCTNMGGQAKLQHAILEVWNSINDQKGKK